MTYQIVQVSLISQILVVASSKSEYHFSVTKKFFAFSILYLLLGCGERSGLIQPSIDPYYGGQGDQEVLVVFSYFSIDPTFNYFSQTYMTSGNDSGEWSGNFQYIFDLSNLTFVALKSNKKIFDGTFECEKVVLGLCRKFRFSQYGFRKSSGFFDISKIKVESVDSGKTAWVPVLSGSWPTYEEENDGKFTVMTVPNYNGSTLYHIDYTSLLYRDLNIPLEGTVPKPVFNYKSVCSWVDEVAATKEVVCRLTDIFTSDVEERRWLISEEP